HYPGSTQETCMNAFARTIPSPRPASDVAARRAGGRAILAAAVLCTAAPLARAQSTPISQGRTVSASTFGEGACHDPDTEAGMEEATDFSQWMPSLHVHSAFCNGEMDAIVTQNSSIASNGIHAEGAVTLSHGVNGSGSVTAATGSTEFSYTFRVFY